MGDYTSRVGLDTTNYESSIKSLLGVVQAFNRETERTDRLQKMITATAKRTSETYKVYQKAIDDQKKALNAQIRAQERLNKLEAQRKPIADRAFVQEVLRGGKAVDQYTKKLERLDARIAKANASMAQAKHKYDELTKQVTTTLGGDIEGSTAKGLKPLTGDLRGLGNAVSEMNTRLKTAYQNLEALQTKYAHFGEITKGMAFSEKLLGDLTKLGLPEQLTADIRRQVDLVKRELADLATDPRFQEAMRLDKVIGNASKISEEYREAYAAITSSMGPYLQRNEEARVLQRKINELLEREAKLRNDLATKKTTHAGPNQTEEELKKVGEELFQKQEELQKFAEARSNKVAAALLRDRRLAVPQTGLSVEEQTQGYRLRGQIEEQLSAIRGEDPARVLRLMFTGTPQERAEMQNRFGALYSAVRQLESLRERSHASEMRRISTEKEEAKRAAEAKLAKQREAAAKQAAYQERRKLENRRPFWTFQQATFDDEVQQQRLLRNFQAQLQQYSVQDQQKILQELDSTDAATVARAQEKYSALHRARTEYSDFMRAMEAKDTAAVKEAQDKRTKAAKEASAKRREQLRKEGDERKRLRIKERTTYAQTHTSLQGLIPVNASFGQKVLIQKEINSLADAFARSNVPMAQFDRTLSEIRRGSTDTIIKFPKIAEALRRVEVAAHEADRTIKRVGLSWEAIGRLTFARALTHVFYGMTTQFWETARAAKEINLQIARIQTISTQIPQSMQQWRHSIRELSEDFSFAQEDIGQALYETVSNQIAEGAQAVDVNRVIAPFALTTGSTLADSVDLISAALNSFNLEATDAERVAAQLFATIDLGRVTATDMANTYGRVSTFTKQANVSMAEMNGMIARLTISGLRFERASTFIINVLNKLAKPTPAFRQFLSEINAASGEDALAIYGLPGVLQKIFDANQGSLEELGVMVRDIRAIIGYSGLLQDLPQLQSTIDQIANENLENYRDKTRIVMESSAVVVGKEIAKMRGYFLDLQGAILDTAAKMVKFFNNNKIVGSFAAVAEFGTTTAGLATAYGAANLLRARVFGGGASDVIRQYGELYAGSQGAKLGPGQKIAQSYFGKRVAAQQAKAAATAGGVALPGIGSAIGFALPRAIGSAAIITGLAYFTRQAMPTITKLIADANDSTTKMVENVKEGYGKIVEAAYDFRKQQKEAVKDDIRDIVLAFNDILREQQEILTNLNKAQEKNLDVAEKRLEMEKTILKASESFVLKRFREDLEFQIGLFKEPEDQLFARGQVLSAQRGDILGLASTNPELATDLFSDWLNEAQGLRSEIQNFATSEDNYRNLPLAAEFLGMTDQMIDQMLNEVLGQLGLTPTGNLLQDLSQFRTATESRDTELKELQELREFLEDRLEKGLETWDQTLDAIQTLNYTQQDLFLKYFGGAAGIPLTDLGKGLLDIVEQQGRIDYTKSQQNYAKIERREPDRRQEFETELINYLDLRNPEGSLSRTLEIVKNAATNMETYYRSERGTELLARRSQILSQLETLVGTIKANDNKIPEAEREKIFPLLQELDSLVDDTYRGLLDTTGEGRLRSLYSWLNNADRYFGELEGVNATISDIAERSRVFDDPRNYLLEYLRPRTAEFTQQDAWRQFLELSRNPPEVNESDNVMLDANTVAITADELRIMSTGQTQYRARGGAIGGPRGTDTVPAWLTPGEFVVNARSAQRHSGLLHAINSQYFDRGGNVEDLLAIKKQLEKEGRSASYSDILAYSKILNPPTVLSPLKKTITNEDVRSYISNRKASYTRPERKRGLTRYDTVGLNTYESFIPYEEMNTTPTNFVTKDGKKQYYHDYLKRKHSRRYTAMEREITQAFREMGFVNETEREARKEQRKISDAKYLIEGRGVTTQQKRRELLQRQIDAVRQSNEVIARRFDIADLAVKGTLGTGIAAGLGFAATPALVAGAGIAGRGILAGLMGGGSGLLGYLGQGLGAAGRGLAYVGKPLLQYGTPFIPIGGGMYLMGPEGVQVLDGLMEMLRYVNPFQDLGIQGYRQGGRVARSYNVRPGAGVGYYSRGGMVSNSTVVNAEINLTSTGSTARDVREIVRGINREAHRGGLNVRN